MAGRSPPRQLPRTLSKRALVSSTALLLTSKARGDGGEETLLDGDQYPETESVFEPALDEDGQAKIDWLVEVPTSADPSGGAGAASTGEEGRS